MRWIFLTLGLLNWRTRGQRLDQFQPRICYEYVTVITYINDTASTCASWDNSFVTITRPYSGTSTIYASITTVIPPPPTDSDEPGTVLVEIPANSEQTPASMPSYTTVTTLYTGTPTVVTPVTSTVSQEGANPGTMFIQIPSSGAPSPSRPPLEPPATDPVSMSEMPPILSSQPLVAPAGGPTTSSQMALFPSEDPTTEEEPTTSTTPSLSATTTDPPGPTFSCDAGGFLMQRNTLFRLNLATGENPVVERGVEPGGNTNVLGYNVMDNFLYAFVSIGDNQKQLIRIDGNGGFALLALVAEDGLNIGDIDENGQFWISARGTRWEQVDLRPGSDTYGQKVGEGQTSGMPVADWVYLENGGDYLYSIRLGSSAVTVRWSRTTHEWEDLQDYGPVVEGNSGLGALYAVDDELWGSDNQTGDIVAFPILRPGVDARKVADGPSTSSNDGARCFRAPYPDGGVL